MKNNPLKHLKNALYGLLIGDAVGVPYEFHMPSNLPALDDIDMTPPAGFDRAHKDTPVGTWSDDGAQALCLLASLNHSQGMDLNDFARRLLNWQNVGYMAVDYRVFDIGVQTSTLLNQRKQQLEQGQDLNTLWRDDVAEHDPYSNGNGSLMRVLPLAVWHQGSDGDLVNMAHAQSWVTHPHPRSQVCCALYCLWAKYIIAGKAYKHAWSHAVRQLEALYKQQDLARHFEELIYHVCPADRTCDATGSGYVVDSLRSALWAQQFESYERVIKSAISLGRDTDTTACIAGGIAGLRFGVDGIPKKWREQLRGRQMIDTFV